MAKKKTKAEELQEAVAEAVGAGRELHLESVDFSDPNRPRTCLEVDFPILSVNRVSSIEAASGAAKKPIYQASKWWARRQSSVFRAMLIAAATKAPEDQGEAAKIVWDAYYGNHQKNEAFRKLKVADIFMGGGTTIVEGARLGMQMYGNDLNPVAWFTTQSVMTDLSLPDLECANDAMMELLKEDLMPYFASDCPCGHKGQWTHKPTGKAMGGDFDPLSLTPEQRPEYEYKGPEIIYTFWAKHGDCVSPECRHRTPIMTTPVVVEKDISIPSWVGHECRACGGRFDVEPKPVRLAPSSPLVVSDDEAPFVTMNLNGEYNCPHCNAAFCDEVALHNGKSVSLKKLQRKTVTLTLLVHPDWLQGVGGLTGTKSVLGGRIGDPLEANLEWYDRRSKTCMLIEYRGSLPDSFTFDGEATTVTTGAKGGTIPKKSSLGCRACGRVHDVSDLIESSGVLAAVAPYVRHVYCPECHAAGSISDGRYFIPANDVRREKAASKEWDSRKDGDLRPFWPYSEIQKGLETHVRTPLHKYHYHHWHEFFNECQLLVHALIQKHIAQLHECNRISREIRNALLTSHQLYLRYNCMFTIWHKKNNQISAFLSNNNLQPKANVVETSVFGAVGEGSWRSASQSLCEAERWKKKPWELVAKDQLSLSFPALAAGIKGKSLKVDPHDPVGGSSRIECKSSTSLDHIDDRSIDLVITDPPFGDIVQYGELSEFFFVWMRLLLKDELSSFTPPNLPVALEAVDNDYRNGNVYGFYQQVLTACWREGYRILKDGGVLAFTFHHDKDGPWVSVLESLFDAGFYLEAALPIRSDETKGEGSKPGTFGAQKVEFDIIHVCRKRLEEPEPISWARLRRQIMKDVRQLQEIIEQHQKEGLGEADLQVIRRGKALEYYSRHYGKVYIEKGREDAFSVKDALVGINQLLDDESDTTSEAPPVLAEPYTRQFLRLFADKTTLDRDQMQKYLRGTGVSPSEFLERGWCSEEKKVFTVADPQEWANQWKGKHRKGMSRDFDQTYFLIGACYDESGIKLSDTLNSGSFVPHPAISDLLDWFAKHGSDTNMKSAAKRAKQIYSSWLAKNTTQVSTQRTLFDLEDDE